jgi:hypothetical protein
VVSVSRREIMMDRKTIKVEEVVEYGNRMLLTVAGNRDFRRGVIEMIERVLFETGTYAGYNYQASEYLRREMDRTRAGSVQAGLSVAACSQSAKAASYFPRSRRYSARRR